MTGALYLYCSQSGGLRIKSVMNWATEARDTVPDPNKRPVGLE